MFSLPSTINITRISIGAIHDLHSLMNNRPTTKMQPLCRRYEMLTALTTITESIIACKSLTYLDLSVNSLEKLPDAITSLIGLEELYLNDTFIEYLPANFGRLINLRILELRDNNLVTLPKSMSRLQLLRRIDIGNNEFKELPEVIGNLISLTELWCDENRIRRITCNLSNLKQMVHFDASNNLLQFLPDDIGNWQKCQEIYVSSNELEELPFSIGLMKSLVTLKLDENQLQELPESICQLENLEEIMVSHNDLFKLPSSIGLLRRLRFLTADENLLRFLPNEICSCSSLTILSVRGNKLTKIPPDLGRLTQLVVLNFVNNFLKNLPVTILNLRRLSALWISDNQSQPLMPLQKEFNESTQSYYLTCYLLPQVIATSDQSRSENNDEQYNNVSSNASIAAAAASGGKRRICFANDPIQEVMTVEATSRLMRSPTPYPKELRMMSKFAAKNVNNQNPIMMAASKMLNQSTDVDDHFNRTGEMTSFDESFATATVLNGNQRSGNGVHIDELGLKTKALEIKEARITATSMDTSMRQDQVDAERFITNGTNIQTALTAEPDFSAQHTYNPYAQHQSIENLDIPMADAEMHVLKPTLKKSFNGYEYQNGDSMAKNDNRQYIEQHQYQYWENAKDIGNPNDSDVDGDNHSNVTKSDIGHPYDQYPQMIGNGERVSANDNTYFKSPLIYEQIEQPYQVVASSPTVFYTTLNGSHQHSVLPRQHQHQKTQYHPEHFTEITDNRMNNSESSSETSSSQLLQQQQDQLPFPPPYHIARALTKKSKQDLLTYDMNHMIRNNGHQQVQIPSSDETNGQSTPVPLLASSSNTPDSDDCNDFNRNYADETIEQNHVDATQDIVPAKPKTTSTSSTPWLFGLHKTPTVVIIPNALLYIQFVYLPWFCKILITQTFALFHLFSPLRSSS